MLMKICCTKYKLQIDQIECMFMLKENISHRPRSIDSLCGGSNLSNLITMKIATNLTKEYKEQKKYNTCFCEKIDPNRYIL